MERFAIKIDKNLRANLYKICRLCGIDNPDKVKVLDEEATINLEDGEPELWKKVLDCIGLLITKDDKMPQFMCTLCVDKINDFFEFREMCYATDGQTRKLLGIKEEPKVKNPTKALTSSFDCKTEDEDVKESVPVISAQRTGRKRRNADMEICLTSMEIKTDEMDDIKPATTSNTSSSKKKRPKIDTTEVDKKPDVDIKPGPASKLGLASKSGPSSKIGPASRLALSKKRLKVEPVAKEKKDIKPPKMLKLMKKKLKVEPPAPVVQEDRKSLVMQKKKKALELLKQRKLAKKVAVVKVEKLRKGSVEAKIKEEEPAPAPAPTQPKVKLKEKCAICGEGFVNKVLLDKHMKSTHIPTVFRYHCVQCNETLKKSMEIKNHNLWHKLSKTPFQCGNCSESSCSIYTYSKHIRDCGQVAYLDAHIPDWHCPDCRGVFETTYLFNIHSCVSNTLVCPGCDRSLKWKEDYFKHIPSCSAAVFRIPPYMSSHIQVKNEAEQPTSPIPQLQAHPLPSVASTTVQPTPPSRITPPLMDSNQCVVIPGNVNLHEETSSPSSKSGSKKGKRITKKDLKRFDKLLKSTMTTLVSIKKEPTQDGVADDEEHSTSSDIRATSESPPGSPAPADDDFHHNDDDDDSADEPMSSQAVGTIKQEIIDEGYRDLYNNIEVNIKREVELTENSSTKVTTPKNKEDDAKEEPITPKPVLKLKITKEHGTLNSILLDSPKSEKKKKKKKRKEEKLKTAEREKTNAVQEPTEDETLAVAESVDEPVMPLPEVIRIKKEIIDPEEEQTAEEQLSNQSNHSTPSIVAATSGTLQISCVSEGVHFNGGEENDMGEQAEITDPVQEEDEHESNPVEEPQEEIDIKPRLEELIPMLRIASVSSGVDILETKVPAKNSPPQIAVSAKPFTITPQIVSVSSGNEAAAYQPDTEKLSEGVEESCEKVDSNENIFDYTQMRIKEEIVDPSYDEQDCEKRQDDEVEDKVEEKEGVDQPESITIEKQAEENAYIANIDFNNLSIKQEKEYIDDGLDNYADFDDDESSETDSETSSDAGDNNTESEREYRDLPSEEDENDSNAIATSPLPPLGLHISAVHSEFTCPQSEDKTEPKIKSNPTTECRDLKIIEINSQEVDHIAGEITSKEGIEPIAVGSVKEENFHCKSLAESLTKSEKHSEEHSVKEENFHCKSLAESLTKSEEHSLEVDHIAGEITSKEGIELTAVRSVKEETFHSKLLAESLTKSEEHSEEGSVKEKNFHCKSLAESLTKSEEQSDIPKDIVDEMKSIPLEGSESKLKENQANLSLSTETMDEDKIHPCLVLPELQDPPVTVDEVIICPSSVSRELQEASPQNQPSTSVASLNDIQGDTQNTSDVSTLDLRTNLCLPAANDIVLKTPVDDVDWTLKTDQPSTETETEHSEGLSSKHSESLDDEEPRSLPFTASLRPDLTISIVEEKALSDKSSDFAPNTTISQNAPDISMVGAKTDPCSFLVTSHAVGGVNYDESCAGTNVSMHDVDQDSLIFPVSNIASSCSSDDISKIIDVTSASSQCTASIYTATALQTIPSEKDINRPLTYFTTQPSLDVLSNSYIETSQRDEVPSTVEQNVSGVPTYESSVLGCTTSDPEKDVNRQEDNVLSSTAQFDVMSDLEPSVAEIDQLIDPASSRVIVQDAEVPALRGFPTTSQNVIEENRTTATQSMGETEQSLISVEVGSNETNFDVFDMVPPSVPQNPSALSIESIKRVVSPFPSSVENVIDHQLPGTSSDFIGDQIATVEDNLKQLNSAEVNQSKCDLNDNNQQESVAEKRSELTNVLQSTSESNQIYPRPDSLESHFSSSMLIESERHSMNSTAGQPTNEITISIHLSNVLANSSLPTPVTVLSSEGNNELNHGLHLINETSPNIPIYSTELQRFTSEPSYVEPNLNFTELCRSTTSLANLAEFQVNLNTSTAGQLHPLMPPSDVHPPLVMPELSALSSNSDVDLSEPVLTEEVQNLLNEDTVATNNFELNESILRARCSTSTDAYSPPRPVAVSIPNFTDFENVNEIAENNNNANIERELQDELGNVLAAAIADRSPNNEADDNNAINENRANYDIT